MTKHARLSASAAERWFNCPASVNEAAKYPRSSSFSAAQGTFAHHIAATCLSLGQSFRTPEEWLGNKSIVDGHEVECDQEMVDGVKEYLRYVYSQLVAGDSEHVEVGLIEALQTLHPDLGGTADFARYRPSDQSLLVADFKYGSGVAVFAEDNRQLMTYALGTLLALKVPAKTVTVAIVQPRLEVDGETVRSFTFPAIQILDFAADLVEAAKRTQGPSQEYKPGYWCRKTFCPAARDCPALQAHQHALLATEFDAQLPVDVAKLAKALDMIEPLKAKIAQLEAYAYEQANRGVEIPGWKLVEKRATRKWVDTDGLKAWAEKNAINPFEEPDLKSPAALEKELPKALKPAIGTFYEKVSSGTTLAPATDNRPPVKSISANDFAALPSPEKAGSVATLF